VDAQNPLALGKHSEPQPDLMVLKKRDDGYRRSHPGPEDVLLLIEVADSSAATDRTVKIPLYARHGVREVWLIDLGARVLEVYREPQQGYGDYRSVERCHGGVVTAGDFPRVAVEVSRVFSWGKKVD
jgi:Uma2 family endonuclease